MINPYKIKILHLQSAVLWVLKRESATLLIITFAVKDLEYRKQKLRNGSVEYYIINTIAAFGVNAY